VVAAIVLVLVIAFGAGVLLFDRNSSDDGPVTAKPGATTKAGEQAPNNKSSGNKSSNDKATTPPTTSKPTTTTSTVAHNPASAFNLTKFKTIGGPISPKSVISTGTGLSFAQNMMYQHTVTVYDADGALVKTIPDSVDLAKFGIGGHPGISRGAPVEAAVNHSRTAVYATNYAMYGANHGPEGSDECSGPAGLTPSYVYQIGLKSLAIDRVGQVGMVPKYVAVTPNDKYVLVTNWCSYDLSVLDLATLKQVKRVPLGAYPRGIVVNNTSSIAYVAVMGSTEIARVNLNSWAVDKFTVGSGPRHLVLSPDGRRLYATLNGANQVIAVDTATNQVVGRINTGSQPRSMTISSDGRALYVVNYSSNTMSVVRTSDLGIAQTLQVPSHPIGISYEPTKFRVWVACYSGEILVYNA
jgi:YVTN family beta-propeller protein